MTTAPSFTETRFDEVTVLEPAGGGAFPPRGNTVVAHGSEATLVLDPSLDVDHDPVDADAVMISTRTRTTSPDCDTSTPRSSRITTRSVGVRSLQVLLDGYGLTPEERAAVDAQIGDTFALTPGFPEAQGIGDGHVFDLGDVTATVVHLPPGHTRGHCGVLVEPTGFFYIADIDLTSFGPPMYGDVGSSVDDYLASIARVREVDARWYGTFHQKGVVEGSKDFRERLTAYEGVIHRREERLLEFLDRPPRQLHEIVEHRLVYRPHVQMPFVDAVERRTAQLHLERLTRHGQVTRTDDGSFHRT